MKVEIFVAESANINANALKEKFLSKLNEFGLKVKGSVKVSGESKTVYARLDTPNVRAFKYVTAAASIFRGDIFATSRTPKTSQRELAIFAANNTKLTGENLFDYAGNRSKAKTVIGRLESLMTEGDLNEKSKEFKKDLELLLGNTELKVTSSKGGTINIEREDGSVAVNLFLKIYKNSPMVVLRFMGRKVPPAFKQRLQHYYTSKEAIKLIKNYITITGKSGSNTNPIKRSTKGKYTLDARGPYSIDIEMFLDGLSKNGSIDLQDEETRNEYEAMKKLGLGLKVLKLVNHSGASLIQLHGTKPNLVKYLKSGYTEGLESDEVKELMSSIKKV